MKPDSDDNEEPCCILLRKIPRGSRSRFKILCIENKTTMEAALRAYIEFAIKNNEVISEEPE